jgi:methionine synthase II (cobalamin-independent)
MQITVQNTDTVNIAGTSLSGYVEATLYELEQVFGSPTYADEDPSKKVQTEWTLSLDGVVATIYNWKTQQTPQGVYRWHIGGFDKGEVEMVQEAVDAYRKAVRAVETYMAD